MIIGAQLDGKFLAGLKAEGGLAPAHGVVGKAPFHLVVARGGIGVMDVQTVPRLHERLVGGICGFVGLGFQRAHESSRQFRLVNDDRLSPAGGIAQLVFIGVAIVAAAVMQVEHKAHLRVVNEILNAAHCGKFGVCCVQTGELAVHISVQAA